MKFYAVSILLTVLLVNENFSQEFTFPIVVTDGTYNKYVYIGINPDGTSGFDPGLDTLAPPPPPSGTFDTRLEYLNEDYYTDIRDSMLNQKEFFLHYALSTGGSIIIYWDSSLVRQYGEFIIRDNITGELYSLDMATTDSLDINLYPVLQNNLKILVTPTGTSGIESNDFNVKESYKLYQNYPNPFNPATRIYYLIPKTCQVTLKVYDVLGNETATLVNREEPMGGYYIDFNASRLSGGVYFYQLIATSNSGQAVDPSTGSGQVFIQTKKMVLIK